MVFKKVKPSGNLRKTSYTSRPVSIPPDFISSPPSSTHPPITYTRIDFSTSPIPEYRDHYAVVLDNVLSPSECQELIYLAQLSAGADANALAWRSDDASEDNKDEELHEAAEREKGERGILARFGCLSLGKKKEEKLFDGWQPALINGGLGLEFRATDYRNSDRIIWDSADVVDRIWSRCLLAPQIGQDLEVIEGEEKRSLLGRRGLSLDQRWKITRLNERMRFLRYGAGQFFRPHRDGVYETPDQKQRTFYTLHLYLNDSVQAKANLKGSVSEAKASEPPAVLPEGPSASSFPTCTGGATTFHSPDQSQRLDIDPLAGRVLIFQHAGLLHSGDDVNEGTKYTLRTDILYERA